MGNSCAGRCKSASVGDYESCPHEANALLSGEIAGSRRVVSVSVRQVRRTLI